MKKDINFSPTFHYARVCRKNTGSWMTFKLSQPLSLDEIADCDYYTLPEIPEWDIYFLSSNNPDESEKR